LTKLSINNLGSVKRILFVAEKFKLDTLWFQKKNGIPKVKSSPKKKPTLIMVFWINSLKTSLGLQSWSSIRSKTARFYNY